MASKIGSAAANRDSKAVLAATSELNIFATIGEGIKKVQKSRGFHFVTKKVKLLWL